MIGAKFDRLLEMLKISKVLAAKELGVTKTAISDITNGRVKNLSGTMIELLKLKYHVNPDYWTHENVAMFIGENAPKMSDAYSRFSQGGLTGLGKSERKLVEDLIAVLSKRSDSRVSSQTRGEEYSHSEQREIVELGSVAAGPLTAEETPTGKKILFPRALIADRGPLYALRVRGDSMIGANIHAGDLAIFRPAPHPQELKQGSIVVALVNGENTLKRLYRSDDGAILRAANEHYPDIPVKRFDELVIQGELRYLLKKVGE